MNSNAWAAFPCNAPLHEKPTRNPMNLMPFLHDFFADHPMVTLILLALTWVAYAAVHSLLAHPPVRQTLQSKFHILAGYRYRQAYNLLACLALLPLAVLVYLPPWPSVWTWEGWAWYLAQGLGGLAVLGIWGSARHYDMAAFIGLRPEGIGAGEFSLSPFHRFVRHPWYSFGLVIIWTRDMSLGDLVSALAITAYLFIGSRLEEQRILALLGPRYQRYCERVPALIPSPWRWLTPREARELVSGQQD